MSYYFIYCTVHGGTKLGFTVLPEVLDSFTLLYQEEWDTLLFFLKRFKAYILGFAVLPGVGYIDNILTRLAVLSEVSGIQLSIEYRPL
jgi:hypothetical protein